VEAELLLVRRLIDNTSLRGGQTLHRLSLGSSLLLARVLPHAIDGASAGRVYMHVLVPVAPYEAEALRVPR
jgi:hypothetical protein